MWNVPLSLKAGNIRESLQPNCHVSIFQIPRLVFQIFEFFCTEMLEKSPFLHVFKLPKSVEEATNLNECVDTYENICRFKCIQDSLEKPSKRISKKIEGMS